MTDTSMLGIGEMKVSSEIDDISLFTYDPVDEDEDEPQPIRIFVEDGADSTDAAAYLNLDEAELFFRKGLAVIERIRTRRAAA